MKWSFISVKEQNVISENTELLSVVKYKLELLINY